MNAKESVFIWIEELYYFYEAFFKALGHLGKVLVLPIVPIPYLLKNIFIAPKLYRFEQHLRAEEVEKPHFEAYYKL